MRSLRALLPFLLLLLVVLLAGCNFTLATDVTPPPGWKPTPVPPTPQVERLYPLTPPDPANGAALYQTKCADCHGPEGKGDGRLANQLPKQPPSFVDPEHAANASPAEWFLTVTQGKMDALMPSFASLPEADRWDIVAYITSLRYAKADQQQGASLYEERCATCHSQGEENAPLTWQNTAGLSDAELRQMLTQADGTKHPAVEGLTPDEVPAIIAYVRTLGTTQAVAAAEPTATATPQAEPTATTTASETATATTGTSEATPEATVEATASATSTSEAKPEQVTIQGTVTNHSGGEVPSGLKVTLYGLDRQTSQVVLQEETQTDADGKFVFKNIEAPFHRIFVVSVEYQGTTYVSDWAIASGNEEIDLPVTIYDTTTDTSTLRADRLHIFFEFPQEGTLRVIELYVISNDGDKTVVPPSPGEPVLHFTLPKGATNLQFQNGGLGGRFVATEAGFGDTQPVPPGQGSHQVLFAYELPYTKKVSVRHPVHLPIDSAILIVPDTGGLKVRSQMFTPAGTQTIEGKNFQVFRSQALQPDQEIAFEVSGRPTPATGPDISSRAGLAIGLGVFGLALIVVGIVLWRRPQTAEEVAEEEAESDEAPPDLEEDPETLMDAILALDDLYQQGKLSEEAYQTRRAELKARLAELLHASDNPTAQDDTPDETGEEEA
ncbi:MAG TPA: c-type cytochrome [Anaerolineae bacterium]|nr:c-type cytochrome [Anaerolineae bacterium]HID84001.1 c-type cytochrome [Anaerolineales bacterium]HIQ09846.1 c-type cytochrome [Anaerolineaceae bacterium]